MVQKRSILGNTGSISARACAGRFTVVAGLCEAGRSGPLWLASVRPAVPGGPGS